MQGNKSEELYEKTLTKYRLFLAFKSYNPKTTHSTMVTLRQGLPQTDRPLYPFAFSKEGGKKVTTLTSLILSTFCITNFVCFLLKGRKIAHQKPTLKYAELVPNEVPRLEPSWELCTIS